MAGCRALLLTIVLIATGCAHRPGVEPDAAIAPVPVETAAPAWKPPFKIHREVLANGLTALLVEDHSVPVVSYMTWFRVGSSQEKRGKTGIAHLFEHMMFKGTEKYPGKQFQRILEQKGGQVNAATGNETTTYYETIASQHLELVMRMEADRLANLKISQKDLDLERSIVKEERRLRIGGNFPAQQYEELLRLAYPDHPYGWPVIGLSSDLDAITVKDCREFFATHYQPGNAVITVAGDFEPAKVRAWLKKYYGGIPGKTVPRQLTAAAVPVPRAEPVTLARPVQTERLLIGYYVPSKYHEDAEAITMLSWALFGLSSSPANILLHREKRLVLGVGAEADLRQAPFLFVVTADVRSGLKSQDVLTEIDRLIEDAKNGLIGAEDLERVKNRLTYAVVNEAKSASGIADWLAAGEVHRNDHLYVARLIQKYQTMTVGKLREVARKYLRADNRIVLVMERGDEKR